MHPPVAPKRPHPHTLHGDMRTDDYYWLNQKQNPDVIQYLEDENRYFEETMRPLRSVQETLYQDMLTRIPAAEERVPVQHGPYFYYSRINPDQQYRTFYRRRASDRSELEHAPEEVVLDVNQLIEGDGFLDVSTVRVSPDHTRLHYLVNRDGTDRYTLVITDIQTGELLDAPIPNVFIHGSTAWDQSGQYVYYITADAVQRPHQLWRRRIGHPHDVLLYEEKDPSVSASVAVSRGGEYLFLTANTKTSSEVWYLHTGQPTDPLRLFQARRPGVRYALEHWQGQFLNLTNEGAENFTLLAVPTENPDPSRQQPLIPYEPERYWQRVYPFQDGLVIAGREHGLTQIWLYRGGELVQLTWDEPLYTAIPGTNLAYDTTEVLIEYQSMLTPLTDYAVDLLTGEKMKLSQDPVRNYDPAQYTQQQLWAKAQDGTLIPVSLMARTESLKETPAPTILYGYGAYGINSDPTFDVSRLALLDRGVIYVIAHVRGGSEMGHGWYQAGKLLNKRNSFTDFGDVARYLIDQGYTTPKQLAARGRSAGGLLMGAVLNLFPDLFEVVVPGVPFVDVVTTMLDASIPLTALEWEEWGNPADPEYYAYMKSYSPYDNVAAVDYPHILVYTGLNDPRVGYFEPAKWVARMRATKTGGDRQLLLKTHMGAGHGGPSGRLARFNERAEEYAFILDKIGMAHS